MDASDTAPKKVRPMNALRPRLEVLEPREVPAGDLVVENLNLRRPDDLKQPDVTVPGDELSVFFRVKNESTTAAAVGLTGIHIYFSADENLSGGDVLVGRVQNVHFNVGPGKSYPVVFQGSIRLPVLNLPTPQFPAGSYHILVEVDAGHRISEEDEGNNVASSSPFPYVFEFGSVGNRSNVELRASGGTRFSISQTGPLKPKGDLVIGGGNIDLNLSSTNKNTFVRADGSPPSPIAMRNISAAATVGGVNMRIVDVDGVANFTGGLGSLRLGALSGLVDIANGFGQPAALRFKSVADANITAADGINSFQSGDWIDADATPDFLKAPVVNELLLTKNNTSGHNGDFEADLIVEATSGVGLGLVDIDGMVRGSIWDVGPAGVVHINQILLGAAEDWTLLAAGRVGELTVAGSFKNVDVSQVSLQADRFGILRVQGELSVGPIEVAGKNNADVAIAKLALSHVTVLSRLTADQGGILQLVTRDWLVRTDLRTRWIGSLLALSDPPLGREGNFGADLTLLGQNPMALTSLEKAEVEGQILPSSWNVFADVKLVTAGSIDTWEFLGGQGTQSPGTLLAHLETVGDFDGNVLTDDLNEILIGKNLSGDIETTRPNAALQLFKTRTAIDANLTVPKAILSLVARDWRGGTIQTGRLDEMSILRDATGSLGVLEDVAIVLTDATFVTGPIKVEAAMQSVTISASQRVQGIETGAWHGGSFTGTTLGNLAIGGDLTDVDFVLMGNAATVFDLGRLRVGGAMAGGTTFNLAHSADTIVLGQMLDSSFTTAAGIFGFRVVGTAGQPTPNFANSNVTAKTINRVVLRDVAETASAPYGISADKITRYRRFTGDVLLELDDLDAAGIQDQAGVDAFRLVLT
jgi:hypothetical protein